MSGVDFGCVLKADFKHTPNTTNSDHSAHRTDTSYSTLLPEPSQRSSGGQSDCVLFQYGACAIDHQLAHACCQRAGGTAQLEEQRRQPRGWIVTKGIAKVLGGWVRKYRHFSLRMYLFVKLQYERQDGFLSKYDCVTIFVPFGYAEVYSTSFWNKGIFRDSLKRNHKI